jgi:hypothetical protein
MAEQITGSLVDLLRRDHVHAQDMAAVLEFLRRRLAEEGVPFAVVGALALRQYGYVRATEDIDILTTRQGLDKIHETLVGRGFVPRGPGLRKRLRETERKVNIDVITSGEHAGSQESPLVYPSPESEDFVELGGIRYPKLETLITFKIASGVWGNRDQDLVDVQKLIRANGLNGTFAPKLPAALRERFLALLQRSHEELELE